MQTFGSLLQIVSWFCLIMSHINIWLIIKASKTKGRFSLKNSISIEQNHVQQGKLMCYYYEVESKNKIKIYAG